MIALFIVLTLCALAGKVYLTFFKEEEWWGNVCLLFGLVFSVVIATFLAYNDQKRDWEKKVANAKTVTGIVQRVSVEVATPSNFATFYIYLRGDSKLYRLSRNISDELPSTREGDRVRVKYVEGKDETIYFDNLDLSPTPPTSTACPERQ